MAVCIIRLLYIEKGTRKIYFQHFEPLPFHSLPDTIWIAQLLLKANLLRFYFAVFFGRNLHMKRKKATALTVTASTSWHRLKKNWNVMSSLSKQRVLQWNTRAGNLYVNKRGCTQIYQGLINRIPQLILTKFFFLTLCRGYPPLMKQYEYFTGCWSKIHLKIKSRRSCCLGQLTQHQPSCWMRFFWLRALLRSQVFWSGQSLKYTC